MRRYKDCWSNKPHIVKLEKAAQPIVFVDYNLKPGTQLDCRNPKPLTMHKDPSKTVRRADCCCGNSVVEVQADPVIYGICNCSNCKKRTGSAFGLSAYFHQSDFQVVCGDFRSYELCNEFGAQKRNFCTNCGTTLFWYAESFKGMIGVAGGCFIKNPLPKPHFIAQNENRCSWVSFHETIKIGFRKEDLPCA